MRRAVFKVFDSLVEAAEWLNKECERVIGERDFIVHADIRAFKKALIHKIKVGGGLDIGIREDEVAVTDEYVNEYLAVLIVESRTHKYRRRDSREQ